MESLRASRRQSLRATLRLIIENGRPINPHMSMRVLFRTPVGNNQGCRIFETEFECNGNDACEDCSKTKLRRHFMNDVRYGNFLNTNYNELINTNDRTEMLARCD